MTHGASTDRIEREPSPLPVATTAHFLELSENSLLVGRLPLPDPFDQSLASKIVAGLLLFGDQTFLDNCLGGDAGVIRARHPQGLVALHPFLADEDVLERVVQGVAQVQRAGHVRRRNDDRVGLAIGVRLAVEVALLFPEGIPAFLGGGVIVLFRQFVEKAVVGHGSTWRCFR